MIIFKKTFVKYELRKQINRIGTKVNSTLYFLYFEKKLELKNVLVKVQIY